ncbi:Uncharacterised protein [Neisseria meningitidis]|nr:Uncharacterised protein [Neisseria meningitidis]
MTHAKPMGFISFQLALRLTRPMPSTAPTKICVLDTGSPISDAPITTDAADSSAVKPEAGCISAKLVPTVLITSLPTNHKPTISAIPKVSIAIGGTTFCAATLLVRKTSIIAANGPMALAISFAPWLNAKPQAVKTCIHENI